MLWSNALSERSRLRNQLVGPEVTAPSRRLIVGRPCLGGTSVRIPFSSRHRRWLDSLSQPALFRLQLLDLLLQPLELLRQPLVLLLELFDPAFEIVLACGRGLVQLGSAALKGLLDLLVNVLWKTAVPASISSS